MPSITGEIVIARPPEVVFDVVADERNEPRYNRRMVAAELLTPGPVGAGTRSRALIRSGRSRVEVEVELTRYERARVLGSRSRSSLRLGRLWPMFDTEGTMTFAPVPGGTCMRWSWRVRPRGPLRLFPRFVARTGARQEQRIWHALKELLERGDTAVAPGGGPPAG